MISSANLSVRPLSFSDISTWKATSFHKPQFTSPQPSLKENTFTGVSDFCLKPLLRAAQPRSAHFECSAYEADWPLDLSIDKEATYEAAKKLRIGIYFATWCGLNVVFNIYNKKVLNAFPYPCSPPPSP